MALIGKNVVVIGGFGGIGLAICKCFLNKKIAKLAIVDLKGDETVLNDLQKDYPNVYITVLQLDITNKSDIEASFKQIINSFKYIDVLVNSAGIIDDSNPELTVNINLVGLINSTLTAFSYLGKNVGGRGGLIVNIASIMGLKPCVPLAVYTASKHGVIGFTRSLGCPYYNEKTGIKVIAICPDATDTGIMRNLKNKTTFPFAEELIRDFSRRPQSPEECANNIMQAIEADKNGSIWISYYGELKEVNSNQFYSGESSQKL